MSKKIHQTRSAEIHSWSDIRAGHETCKNYLHQCTVYLRGCKARTCNEDFNPHFYSSEEHLIVSSITKTKWFFSSKNPEYQIFHTIKPQEELRSKAKVGLSPEIFKWCFMVRLDFLELSGCQKNHLLPKI